MKKRFDALQVIWILFALSSLVAVVMTVQSFATYGRQRAWLEGRIEDFNNLARLEQDIGRQRAALYTLEQMESAELSPVNQVVSELLIDSEYEVEQGRVEDISNDWRLRKAVVVFDRISAGKLFDLVSELEARRPPWRVVGISVQALPNEYGELRASVNLEGLERR